MAPWKGYLEAMQPPPGAPPLPPYVNWEKLGVLAVERPHIVAFFALGVILFLWVVSLALRPPGRKIVALVKAKQMIIDMIRKNSCHPIMLRLAWHDAGTYDMKHKDLPWPAAGGAIGSIRYSKEINAGPNAGLSKALGYLDPIRRACPEVSMADLIQMAGATAVELAGGPRIDMIYGRMDASDSPEQSVAPFGLPDAFPDDPASHLRWVFGKYDGMGDKEIVALSGAHTIGRAFKERSGAVENGYGEKGATKFTCPKWHASGRADRPNGMPGGKSWTPRWLKFDNSYFSLPGKEEPDDLLVLPTDRVLEVDPGFKPFFDKYREDQAAFFADYAAAHKKLSELGSKFEPAAGLRI